MFEFLRGKRRPEEAAALAEPPARPKAEAPIPMRPGKEVSYSADLIPRLLSDHRHLFEAFDEAERAFREADYAVVATQLDQLQSMLRDHLMLENIKLYVYLRQNLAHEPSDYQLVTGFRKEMDGIGREAMAFVDQYKRMAEEPALRASFAGDAQRIRQIVHDRMSREEATLYQLYQPSY